MRVRSAADVGHHVVVQGGTFLNDAILRALELILGIQVIRPDIAGLMGAFGAALEIRERYLHSQKDCRSEWKSTLLSLDKLKILQWETVNKRCGKCYNNW